ncbi:MAG: 16S rRNA (cytosine(1402)-N(4))-methyltransferase RsmH [Pseudomonadota bacterium]
MTAAPHVPVLLQPVLAALQPLDGARVLDGTFGAGGYSRAILAAGAARVLGVDRDPAAVAGAFADPRLSVVEGTFGRLDDLAEGADMATVDAVVLDIGVSSMQLDQAERGFSFLRDGPLDMRMSGAGASAADLVNRAPEGALAEILKVFGEERAARRIARAIVAARQDGPLTGTVGLAEIVAGCLPRPKPGQPHPATRSFQALRIAVNDELRQLARALEAAERCLAPGGRLAVVTFHSLEDRIVKRYLAAASSSGGGGSRHMPERAALSPRFEAVAKSVAPGAAEIAANPRARSAKLRAARRTAAPAGTVPPATLGLPAMPAWRRAGRAG